MKFIITISLFLSTTFSVFAQSDTVFFNAKWETVLSRNEASFFRLIREENGKFKVTDYYLSSKQQMTGYFDLNAGDRLHGISGTDGYRNGKFDYYYETGKKSSEGIYEKGNKEGEWKYYDSAGLLIELHHYYRGLRDGDFITYYPNTGQVKSIFKYDESQIVTQKFYDEKGKEQHPKIYKYVEQMPVPGYDVATFLGEHIVYPQAAIDSNIEGRSLIQFTVDIDGSITDVKAISRFFPPCNEEGIRVVSLMPPWKPGMQKGVPVKVYYTLPIKFSLPKDTRNKKR